MQRLRAKATLIETPEAKKSFVAVQQTSMTDVSSAQDIALDGAPPAAKSFDWVSWALDAMIRLDPPCCKSEPSNGPQSGSPMFWAKASVQKHVLFLSAEKFTLSGAIQFPDRALFLFFTSSSFAVSSLPIELGCIESCSPVLIGAPGKHKKELLKMSTPSTGAAGGSTAAPSTQQGDAIRNVPILLKTSIPGASIPLTPYLVPVSWRRTHLSTLVNRVLRTTAGENDAATAAAIPFDFIVDGQLLRNTSLGEYISRQGKDAEVTLELEYVRSNLPPRFENQIPQDDWVGSVDASRDG